MSNVMAKKDYDLVEITRLLLDMRDNCLPKDGDTYDDPKRNEKYAALNAAIDLINNPSRLESMSDQISVKVLCPYCGAEMRMISAWRMTMPEMGGFVWRARGKCPSCGSLTPETHGRTAREANEAAYAAALRRYEPPKEDE